MNDDGILDRDHRVALAPGPRWAVTVIVVALWTALAAGVVAGLAALLGAAVRFDAAPLASVLGVLALAAVVTASVTAGAVAYVRRWRALVDPAYDVDPIPLDAVPERPALRHAQARAIAARLERQREARNQSAASGGSVTSADAGLPPHDSSEATTAP